MVNENLLRLSEILKRTGLSRSTLYSMISKNEFPSPLKIGARASAWVESEVNRWIDEKISSRNNRKGGC